MSKPYDLDNKYKYEATMFEFDLKMWRLCEEEYRTLCACVVYRDKADARLRMEIHTAINACNYYQACAIAMASVGP